jgi:signal transduction histidine kinase/ActR/RegA family two-component response regulator
MIAVFSSCERAVESERPPVEPPVYSSFRDIPGVTAKEIEAIEKLQKEHEFFIYGMNPSTEAFLDENGNINGFSTLFCEWLTGLFGIRFTPEFLRSADVLEIAREGRIDFSGDMRITEERKKIFLATDPIALRSIKMIRVKGSPSIENIMQTRLPRYAFVKGTISIADVAAVTEPGSYEELLFDIGEDFHKVLKDGKADALITLNPLEAMFDRDNDIVTEDFLPLIFSPVSLVTTKREYEPIISVVQKALKSGATAHLTELYERGYSKYKKHKFLASLSEEEKAYIQNTGAVPIAVQYFNYPIIFYDKHKKVWDGITIDLLNEVERLTGLSFEVVNSEHAEMLELIQMLTDGRAHMFSDLVFSKERAPYFIWGEYKIMRDQYALLSKDEFPNINVNEIPFVRVALIKNTAHAEMFRSWFPHAINMREYDNADAAFGALERGEADFVMAAVSKLLFYANYYDYSGYKANYTFGHHYNSTFAFNMGQTVLRSVMDKALSIIYTDRIVSQWMTKTYDYERKLAEQRSKFISQFLLIMTISAFVVCSLLVALILQLVKNNRLRKLKIAKLEEAGEQIRIALIKAQEASRAKSDFLSTMSHEMRTPMNAIIGMTHIGKKGDSIEEKNNALNKITNASSHLLGVINDVLDMAKIEANKLEFAPVKFNFEKMLQRVMTVINFRIDEKLQQLSINIDKNIPVCLVGDDHRLAQVITNLLSNAVKFTPEGGEIQLDASLSYETDEYCELRIEVTDNGIGVAPEHHDKLFGMFEQAESGISREYGGTGLGLVISKNIIELMGGKIWVESELGKGTRFTFTIKAQRGETESAGEGKKENHEESIQHVNDFSGKKLLIAEDIEINREILIALLEDSGITIDCAENGQIALDKLEAAPDKYDMVLMDVQMPKMDGLEATKRIRAMSIKLPIVAMTANVFKEDVETCIAAGMDDHLGKPIDTDKLFDTLRKYLRGEEGKL